MLAEKWTSLHGQRAGLRTAWWPMASPARLQGELMLARDRHQDGQRDGQCENIMLPLRAVRAVRILQCSGIEFRQNKRSK